MNYKRIKGKGVEVREKKLVKIKDFEERKIDPDALKAKADMEREIEEVDRLLKSLEEDKWPMMGQRIGQLGIEETLLMGEVAITKEGYTYVKGNVRRGKNVVAVVVLKDPENGKETELRKKYFENYRIFTLRPEITSAFRPFFVFKPIDYDDNGLPGVMYLLDKLPTV